MLSALIHTTLEALREGEGVSSSLEGFRRRACRLVSLSLSPPSMASERVLRPAS
ncbi:hypothetical protein BD311DRAFT_761549, partial [Dichomitus squalens]